MKSIKKEFLANAKNPHYFIFKNFISFLTKDAEVIDFLPFKDAGEAKKYAKKIGCFSEFANGFSYDKVSHKISLK
jgi:hypothetical protein